MGNGGISLMASATHNSSDTKQEFYIANENAPLLTWFNFDPSIDK